MDEIWNEVCETFDGCDRLKRKIIFLSYSYYYFYCYYFHYLL